MGWPGGLSAAILAGQMARDPWTIHSSLAGLMQGP